MEAGWLEHALRMESKEEPVRIFALYEPEIRHGQARRGAKKLSYKGQIAKMLTGCSDKLTDEELRALAMDRSKWREQERTRQATEALEVSIILLYIIMEASFSRKEM